MILKLENIKFIYCFFILFFFSLELNTPLVFYGTQFFGISFLILIRFFLFSQVSQKKLIISFLIFLIWELLVFIQSKYTIYDNLIINSQKSIFLFVSMIFICDMLLIIKNKIIIDVVNFYIMLLSVVVAYQLVGFYILGLSDSFLDFSILLGGEVSRSAYIDGMYRPTGLMPEPAIFISVQLALLIIQYLLNKDNNFYRVFGIVSIFMSLSFAGISLVSLYCLLVYTKNLKNLFFLILGSILPLYFLYEFLLKRYELIVSGEDSSNSVKVDAINYFLSNNEFILFGYGNIVSTAHTPKFFEGATDISFYLASLTIFGLFIGLCILMVFFTWLFKSSYNFREKTLILLALVKLSNPAVIFFSCFIWVVIVLNKKRKFNL